MENQKRLFVALSQHMSEECAQKMLAELGEHFDDPVAATNEFIRHISRLTKSHLFTGWHDFDMFCRVRRGFVSGEKLSTEVVFGYFFDVDTAQELDLLIETDLVSSPRFSNARWRRQCFVPRE